MKDFVYKVSDWQRAQAKLQYIREEAQRITIGDGEAKLGGWRHLHDEVFHRLYAQEESPLAIEDRAPGADPYAAIHGEIGNLREFSDLKSQCVGDDWLSARAAAALERHIITAGLPGVDGVEDPRVDADALEALRAMLEDVPEDAREEYEERLEEKESEVTQKVAASEKAAGDIDPTTMRNAIRAGLRAAKEAVDEANEMVAGLGFGADEHSSKSNRRELGMKLAPVVAGNPRLKKIAEMAGRLRRIADRERAKTPRKGSGVLTGIETGAEMERMLPSELAGALGAFRPVFAAKMLERSVMQYKHSPPPAKQAGPIVVCLDSSGSMGCDSGAPSNWAAAVALAFMHVAAKDKRPVALVHFGSTVLRVDEFEGKSIDPMKAIEAVSFFASDGGTSFTHPLQKANELIDKMKAFEHADIVFVTDGEAHLDEPWKATFNGWRSRRGVRMYSILVGDAARSRSNTVLNSVSDEVVCVADALRDDSAVHSLLGKAAAK
jgi:uncharacterized protein with von Willebrand factor type A (vWA) domain